VSIGDSEDGVRVPGDFHSSAGLTTRLVADCGSRAGWYERVFVRDQPDHPGGVAVHDPSSCLAQGKVIVTLPLDVVRVAVPLAIYS